MSSKMHGTRSIVYDSITTSSLLADVSHFFFPMVLIPQIRKQSNDVFICSIEKSTKATSYASVDDMVMQWWRFEVAHNVPPHNWTQKC